MANFFKFIFVLFVIQRSLEASVIGISVEPESERKVIESLFLNRYQSDLTEADIEDLRTAINETKRYQGINISWDAKERKVWVSVEPTSYFSEFVFLSDPFVFQSDLQRNCLSSFEVRPLSQERLSQVVRCMVNFLQDVGYLDADVVIAEDGENLNVTVNRGARYRVDDVEFIGVTHLSERRLATQIVNRRGMFFSGREFEEDTKRLIRFLQRDGFYFAEVFQPSIQVDSVASTVRLIWKINEGPRFRLRFLGDRFDASELDQFLEREEPFPRWFIEEISDALESRLREQGFLDAVVRVDKRIAADGVEEIDFVTVEGKRYKLIDPEWVGTLRPDVFEKRYQQVWNLRTGAFYQPEIFRKALESDFLNAVMADGYVEAVIRSVDFQVNPQAATVKPVVYFQEGERALIETVVFTGFDAAAQKLQEFQDLQQMLSVGSAFDADRVKGAQDLLNRALVNLGYLDAVVDRRSSKVDGGLKIEIIASLGKRYRISHVVIQGAVRTQYMIARREIRLRAGDYFENERVKDAIDHFLRLGVARSLEIQPVQKNATTGEVIALVILGEAPHVRIDLGPGYGTIDGIRAVIRATYANIGGSGRRLTAYLKANRKLEESFTPSADDFVDAEEVPFVQRKMSLEYLEPSLFGFTFFDARVVYWHSKQDLDRYGLLRNALSLSLDTRPSRRWLLTTQYEIEISNPFNVRRERDALGNEILQRIDAGSKRLSSVGEIVQVDYVDDKLAPTRGTVGYYDGFVFTDLLSSDVNFWQTTQKQAFLVPIHTFSKNKIFGFSISLNTGFAAPFGDTPEIPIERRFSVGGENSVRGYGERAINPLIRSSDIVVNGQVERNYVELEGGNSFFFFRSELYFPLFMGVDALLFFDGGNAFRENRNLRPWDLRYGAGPGLRWNTPVGPFKIGYGFILNPLYIDGRKEGLGSFYLALGAI